MTSELLMALSPSDWVRSTQGMEPDDWQIVFLDDLKSRRRILNIARQNGKSQVCAWAGAWSMVYQAPYFVILAAPTARQSMELAIKVREALSKAGEADYDTKDDAKLSFSLKNGSRCVILSGNADSARGYSRPDAIYVDEASRCPDEEGLIEGALMPMMIASPDSRFVMMSTPWGRHNFFAKIWLSDSNWVRVRQTAAENVRIDKDWLAEQKRTMIEAIYLSEFCCEITDRESAVFRWDALQKCISTEIIGIWQNEEDFE
jgi:hypothetical protein